MSRVDNGIIHGIAGCVFVGLAFGWEIGAATYCLFPLLLKAIRRSGMPSNA